MAKLFMSRSRVTHGFSFWRNQPDVSWNDAGEICIGYDVQEGDLICEMHGVHELFPSLEIPPGEIAEIEVVELEHGYYIGFVE